METIELKNIGKFQSGGTPSKKEPSYFGGNIPWITTVALNGEVIDQNNATDWLTEKGVSNSATKIVPPLSLMIGTRVGIGKVAVNKVGMCTNQDIISITDINNEKWDLDYLRFFIKSVAPKLNEQARGATIQGIKIDVLQRMKLPLKGLNEQRKIATVLQKVKIVIDNRNEQIAELDKLIKSRFVEMFGDPVSNLKRWTKYKLKDVCKVNPKKSDDNRLMEDLEVSFVAMPSVSDKGELDASIIKLYREVKTGFTYFAENDVLFAKITPCMENGKGAVAVGLKNGVGFGSTEFHVLRPVENKTNPYWVYYLTMFDSFRGEAERKMTGSAGQRRVPSSFLENYEVGVPSIDLQNQFATFVQQVDKLKVVYS